MINSGDFTRKFSVIGTNQFAFFLGAGASASSNIPTATEMIWDFKRILYAAEKGIKITTIQQRFYEFEKEIESWIKAKYEDGPENEYGFFFEKAFPSRQDRKKYITKALEFAKPNIGYNVIKFLIEEKTIWHYITTNFDNLIQQVYPNVVEISEDTINRAENYIRANSDLPVVTKLHGDFRYDWLRNTDEETQALNTLAMDKLRDLFKSLGLMIIGYSGRDNSVMSFLEEFVENESKPFPNGFYWCVREGETTRERCKAMIGKLRKKEIEADFVTITSFDDLLIGIYNQIGKNHAEIDEWLSSKRKLQRFKTASQHKDNYIVLDFMKVTEYPRTFFTFKFNNIGDWEELRGITKGKNVIASFFRQEKIIAVGDENEIKETFNGYINGASGFEYYTLTDGDLTRLNNRSGPIYSMFYDIFNSHFEKTLDLKRYDNRRIFYTEKEFEKELRRYSRTMRYHKAFRYCLEFRGNKLLFILTPYYLTSEFESLNEEEFNTQQNMLISNMFNRDVLNDLTYWMKILKNGESESIKILFPSNTLRFLIQPKFYKCGEGVDA